MGINLQPVLKQSACTVVVLLKEEPFSGDVKDVLVARIPLQQVVHARNGGKEIAVLDVGHPAHQELFVGSRAA